MKKVVTSLLVFTSLFFFTACGKKVNTEDLKANDWLIEATKNDEPDIIASFSDHIATFKIDSSSIKSTASNEWEALGEEFTKSLTEEINYKSEYILKNNELILKDEDNENEETKYTISKEGKNIILTPEKTNKSDDKERLVLKPYKKKETKESRTATSSTASNEQSSSNIESIVESSNTVDQTAIEQNTSSETSSAYSAESVENYSEATPISSTEQSSATPSSTEQSVPQDYGQAGQAQATVTSSSTSFNETTTVQAGESPKQVAERAGITTDQLFELNGIDPNNYMLYPGQELRIK